MSDYANNIVQTVDGVQQHGSGHDHYIDVCCVRGMAKGEGVGGRTKNVTHNVR